MFNFLKRGASPAGSPKAEDRWKAQIDGLESGLNAAIAGAFGAPGEDTSQTATAAGSKSKALEQSVAALAMFARQISDENTRLVRINEGLTVDNETGKMTILELMAKLRKMGGGAAVASAQQRQGELQAEIAARAQQQRHKEEVELRTATPKQQQQPQLGSGDSIDDHRSQPLSLSSSFAGQQQAEPSNGVGAGTAVLSPSSAAAAAAAAVASSAVSNGSFSERFAAELAAAEQQATTLRQQLQERDRELSQQQQRCDELRQQLQERDRELSQQQQRCDELRQAADRESEMSRTMLAQLQAERDAAERLRTELGTSKHWAAMAALRADESAARLLVVEREESEALVAALVCPFLGGLQAAWTAERTKLTNELRENTRALMLAQSASASPPSSPSKSRFSL